MGATNCPETPRQRMISMMYLVLTALLALNVSVEILNAFVTVNESMEKTNANFADKNAGTYSMFEAAYTTNKEKVGPFWKKAQKAQTYTKDLLDYVNNLKYQLFIKSGDAETIEEAKKVKVKDIKKKDNYDIPTQFFIGQSESGAGGRGEDLKNKIIEFKKNMLALLDTKDTSKVNLGLNVEGNGFKDPDGKSQNWQQHNFYRTIIVATTTILNKVQAEILNIEYDIVNQLYSAVDQGKMAFDRIEAKVIPASNYVLLGDEYQAEIFVGAFDTKSVITANIDGSTIEGDTGLISYRVPASSEGLKKYEGNISVKTPFGTRDYPFKSEYIVAKPSATVSADKMNVFYIGVDNPVTVSVPGVANEKVRPSISGGSMRPKGGGKYIVKVNKRAGAKAIVTINADFDGKMKAMGRSEFRVKRVPDPVPSIGGVSEGFIPKGRLTASGGIIAKLKEFDFDLKMRVTSFTMQTIRGGDLTPKMISKGNRFTPAMLAVLSKAKRGQKFWFENITAKAPDGNRRLPAINLTIR